MASLAEQAIEPFDLVCVSLYPFASVAAKRGASEAEVIEMIDVGGPSMLRAAAKNFAHVAVVSSPEQYETVLGELRDHGEVTLDTRRELARAAFATTAAYEAAIATWFGETEAFPEQLTLAFRKVDRPLLRREPAPARRVLPRGRCCAATCSPRSSSSAARSSRTTTSPTSKAARRIVREFALPAVVLVKHANPCGVAVAATIEEAWERALAADPVSAFGCVAILNRPVSAELGARIAEHFVEVLLAPGYDEEAPTALRTKKSLRLLVSHERRAETPGERDLKRVLGGLLVQERDADVADRKTMQIVTGEVTEEQWGDLLFAWRVCKHVSLECDRARPATCRRSASARVR